MSLFLLWLLFVLLPNILEWAPPILVLGSILWVAGTVVGFSCPDDEWPPEAKSRFIKTVKRLGWTLCVMFVFVMCAPSERAVYTIAGAYIITNTEGVTNLPQNLVGAANRFLEDYNTSKEISK